MDENATKALYIAVTIFIVMLTLGFVVAYFNTARKAGNLAILGSAVAENYEKLLNSDLDKAEMTGVEVINMLRKYGGKYLFCFDNNAEREEGIEYIPFIYVMTNEKLMTSDRVTERVDDIRDNMHGYEDAIIYMDGNGNVPSKFLETINPNIVYTVFKTDRSKLTNAEEIAKIFCGADIRLDIFVKNPADYAFISSETEVYVSEEENPEEVEHTNTMKKYFSATLSLIEDEKSFNISTGKWTIKLLCDATESNITFSSSTSGDTVHSNMHVYDHSGTEVKFDFIKFDNTGEAGKMVIEINGLPGNSANYYKLYIGQITLEEGAFRSRDGKYSKKMTVDKGFLLDVDISL